MPKKLISQSCRDAIIGAFSQARIYSRYIALQIEPGRLRKEIEA